MERKEKKADVRRVVEEVVRVEIVGVRQRKKK